jgi:hypothetical protein
MNKYSPLIQSMMWFLISFVVLMVIGFVSENCRIIHIFNHDALICNLG